MSHSHSYILIALEVKGRKVIRLNKYLCHNVPRLPYGLGEGYMRMMGSIPLRALQN